jgi:hypothetical protein
MSLHSLNFISERVTFCLFHLFLFRLRFLFLLTTLFPFFPYNPFIYIFFSSFFTVFDLSLLLASSFYLPSMILPSLFVAFLQAQLLNYLFTYLCWGHVVA